MSIMAHPLRSPFRSETAVLTLQRIGDGKVEPMVATMNDGNLDVPIGDPVYTADGKRLGYVVDADAYQMDVGDGFLFRRNYSLQLSDVERYEDGSLVLALTVEQVLEQQRLG